MWKIKQRRPFSLWATWFVVRTGQMYRDDMRIRVRKWVSVHYSSISPLWRDIFRTSIDDKRKKKPDQHPFFFLLPWLKSGRCSRDMRRTQRSRFLIMSQFIHKLSSELFTALLWNPAWVHRRQQIYLHEEACGCSNGGVSLITGNWVTDRLAHCENVNP